MTSHENLRAMMINALSRISGENGEPSPADFNQAVKELDQIADAYPPAKAKLAAFEALGIGGPIIGEDANNLILSSAMRGFPPAIRELGLQIILSGTDKGMGAGLLCRAASAGDWVAGFLVLREACRRPIFSQCTELTRARRTAIGCSAV